MDKYRNLHLWMVAATVVMQATIFMDYWGDFTENSWSIHVHYWVASAWYVYLIVQPYLATRGSMGAHRTNGIVGMFLAGGVGMTSLSMMHRDIRLVERSLEEPERFGPFEPWFFYGICVCEIVMVLTFMAAVLMSIVRRRVLLDHVAWLVATVFIIMMPALGRGLQFLWIQIHGFESDAVVMQPLYLALALIIAATLWTARSFGFVKHPATYVAVGINAFVFLLEPIGRWEPLQELLHAAIRG
ncbi:MAG: hypothetical protein ACYS26_16065 [Planctomycetota bacterium]|jgi:hypothetical protein